MTTHSREKYRILVVHNAYQQRGGEDSVVEAELALLRSRGHEVFEYRRSNTDLDHMSKWQTAVTTMWSRKTTQDISNLLNETKVDIVHVHNTLPLISPSVYWAAANLGVPVIQTLHNYRLICPQALLMRNGGVCEQCVGRMPVPCITNRCYRGSVAQSAAISSMLLLHRSIGTWAGKIDRYIALTEFGRGKFIEGGLPPNKIVVKPNFVSDPGLNFSDTKSTEGIFVGRLSPEKGIDTLIAAVQQHGALPPLVVGEGPMLDQVAKAFGSQAVGLKTRHEVFELIKSRPYLVMPSIWYEGFGMTVIEAYSLGVPVIASRLGALPELVDDGQTGLLFEPGNAADLADKMAWAHANPDAMIRMGQAARVKFETHYTADSNYVQLMAIYRQAIADKRNP